MHKGLRTPSSFWVATRRSHCLTTLVAQTSVLNRYRSQRADHDCIATKQSGQSRYYTSEHTGRRSDHELEHHTQSLTRKQPAIRIATRTLTTSSTAPQDLPASTADEASNDVQSHPPYKPPTTGILSLLPSPLIPYGELARLDKPAGTIYLFFPCAFSTLLAAPLAAAPPLAIAGTTMLFLTGALIMRGAGCTINDLWDRNLDPHVARTRLRPLARRAVSVPSAVLFFGGQCLTGLVVLLQFPTVCLFYGIPSLILVATYPLAKRVTYYPQVVLGCAFSWGAFMGFPALGIDLLSDSAALGGAAALYASCIAWTCLYDAIYAHMDIKDDVKAGIKSIALAHESKAFLATMAAVQTGFLALTGWCTGAGPLFYAGSCVGGFATLANMIYRVDLKNVASCWWWFRNGCWFTGLAVSLGLAADYVARADEEDIEPVSNS